MIKITSNATTIEDIKKSGLDIKQKLSKINCTKADNIKRIDYIVVHYVGATGGAMANANYFYDNYRGSSAHYFIGHEGEIVQVVSDANIAWHCGTKGSYKHSACRNSNSVGVELCCKKDSRGIWYFEKATVKSAQSLIGILQKNYNIAATNIIRHFDVTGKNCPEPYVRDEKAWQNFKAGIVKGGKIIMPRYNNIKEVPSYAKTTIEKLIKKDLLTGDKQGLNLTEDMLRILVINDRAELYK